MNCSPTFWTWRSSRSTWENTSATGWFAKRPGVTHQQGYRFMSANVSASNERSLLSAIKLGFDVERIGLVMACDATGIAKMPGRPAVARGHAVDRAARLRRRQRKTVTEERNTQS